MGYIKKGGLLFFIWLTGAYIVQRLTAGNAYAKPENNFPGQTQTGGKTLRYFKKEEFGKWWPDMSTELLDKLDEFRHRLGSPVYISPASGSLGRHLGYGDLSQHNIDMWGEVRAVDVMIADTIPLKTAFEIAKSVGFSGIGLYPDWKPHHGLHLDVRQAPLALWSGILENGQQVYKSIKEALA